MTRPDKAPKDPIRRLDTVELVEVRNPVSRSVASGGVQGLLFGPLAAQPSAGEPEIRKFPFGGWLYPQIGTAILIAMFSTMMCIASVFVWDAFSLAENIIQIALFPFSAFNLAGLTLKWSNARRVSLYYFGSIASYYFACTAIKLFQNGVQDIEWEGKYALYLLVSLGGAISFVYIYRSKRVLLTYSPTAPISSMHSSTAATQHH